MLKTLKSLKMHLVKSFLFLSKFLWTPDNNLDHLESTLLTNHKSAHSNHCTCQIYCHTSQKCHVMGVILQF